MIKKRFSIIILMIVAALQSAIGLPVGMKTLRGTIKSNKESIPFATVAVKGTTLGAVADLNGEFELTITHNKAVTLVASAVGYKSKEINFAVGNLPDNVNFTLEDDVLGLEEVVVSVDRSSQRRSDAALFVNTLSPKSLESCQAITLNEGISFTPGLRVEMNCQNCGLSQVRMNGQGGNYSQILINGRPLFSGLAAVYGLEVVPASIVERIEVVRGGGSSLYGSNAIAGTINMILQEPMSSSASIGYNYGLNGVGMDGTGGTAGDHMLNFNVSMVKPDYKSGFTLYGNYRTRDPFDANNDGFSEVTKIKNITLGGRLTHKTGYRSKLAIDFLNVNENRRGGDKFNYPEHEANIAESIQQNISTAMISFDKFYRENDIMTLFASTQFVDRDSYYGAGQSLADYGKTTDVTYNFGGQYKFDFNSANLLLGVENTGGKLFDKKLGYADWENATTNANGELEPEHIPNSVIANQFSNIMGVFTQLEKNWDKFKVSAGIRYDYYLIRDNQKEADDVTGNVLSPRIGIMYKLAQGLQLRANMSRGYRAPQIFDEDLHIESSKARKIIHKNADNLKAETSMSYMFSLDAKRQFGNMLASLLIEGFYTRLNNPFSNEYGTPDADGVVIYTRVNAESGAEVKGINIELNLKPGQDFTLSSGMTVQRSRFDDPQELDEKKFLRTPDLYGFALADWDFADGFCLSANLTYTGKMLVPYFGPLLPVPEDGTIIKTDDFFDLGAKLAYEFNLGTSKMTISAGVKNIFNSYQKDFDKGEYRDPSFIYGPGLPRSIFAAVNINL
jgi:outer membrane receptor for ferrienterochelin and colicins